MNELMSLRDEVARAETNRASSAEMILANQIADLWTMIVLLKERIAELELKAAGK